MSLKNKQLIFNSDDFGHSHPFNMGIYKGLKAGVLTTSCVMANMEGYSEAASLVSEFKGLRFGVHLNLYEGKSLTGGNLLVDSKGEFNNSFIDTLRKSYDKNFLKQVEFEYRAQIERVLGDFDVDALNSHVHYHAIPNLFKIVSKLADEYNISYIRTQFEHPYYSKMIPPANLLKLGLLNFLTVQNKKYLGEKMTNDYLIGVTYTGVMDKNTVLDGLRAINSGLVEILIHPADYENEVLKQNCYNEYLITQDSTITDEIKALGFELIGTSGIKKEAEIQPHVI